MNEYTRHIYFIFAVTIGMLIYSLENDFVKNEQCYTSITGKDLFQGDIILTKEQQMLLDENSGHTYGAMKTSLWPKVIPYELSPEIGKILLTKL